MENTFKPSRLFGSTEQPNKFILNKYPNAKFVPVCALGCYYAVYSDDSYSTKIAEYLYRKPTQPLTKQAREELTPFGSYFTINWLINFVN